MTFVAGIDMGAKSTKAVVMDGEKRICGKAAIKTRPDFAAVAKEVLDLALQRAGLKENDLNYIATTGFGRYNVPFRDVQITDITCVGRGAVFLFPKTRCVLDIGAQSTRALGSATPARCASSAPTTSAPPAPAASSSALANIWRSISIRSAISPFRLISRKPSAASARFWPNRRSSITSQTERLSKTFCAASTTHWLLAP